MYSLASEDCEDHLSDEAMSSAGLRSAYHSCWLWMKMLTGTAIVILLGVDVVSGIPETVRLIIYDALQLLLIRKLGPASRSPRLSLDAESGPAKRMNCWNKHQ